MLCILVDIFPSLGMHLFVLINFADKKITENKQLQAFVKIEIFIETIIIEIHTFI